MNIDFIRAHCMSLPHVTEQVQWGDDLIFKIAGKMFAGAPLGAHRRESVVRGSEKSPHRIALSFKATQEEFAELIERPGIVPAPYMARAFWVALETHDALPPAELKHRLTRSYDLVFAKLPKKTQAELTAQSGSKRTSPAKRKSVKRPQRGTARSRG